MGVSKVTFFGKNLIDLTGDTVSSATLAKGETAHDKSGAAIIGELVAGGLPSGFTAVATGTHTLSSAVTGGKTFTVTHNLGVVPDMFLFYTPENIASAYSELLTMRCSNWLYKGSSYPNKCFYHGNTATNMTGADLSTSYGIKTLTTTQATITTHSGSSSYAWRAATYKWVAIKF